MNKLENCKVVLVEVSKNADRYLLCKTLANELGIPLEEATQIIEDAPTEVFPSIPEDAAEVFADKIRKVGATLEVLPLSLKPFCKAHPHKRARAKCKVTGDYICEIEILAAGKHLLSTEGLRIFKRRRRIQFALSLALVVALVVGFLVAIPIVNKMKFEQKIKDGVSVGLVFVSDLTTRDSLRWYNRLVADSRDPRDIRFFTLANIMNADYQRYTGIDKNWMSLDTTGVYQVEKDLPVPETSDTLAIGKFFREMNKNNSIDEDRFEMIVYVYLVLHDTFPNRPEIRDLVLVSGNKAIVRVVADQPEHRDYYMSAILYGIGKALGASCKIDDEGLVIYPGGYVQPENGADETQKYAEVMAGGRATLNRNLIRITDITDVRVGEVTARELGWID